MKKKHISMISEAMGEKISLLIEFKGITEKMISADLDAMAELIAERQVLIQKIDSIQSDINVQIDRLPDDEKTVVTDILAHKKPEVPESLLQILNKAEEIENLLVEIMVIEKKVAVSMEKIQSELLTDMQKMNKSKQVIDYFSSFSGVKPNGEQLNSLS